MKRLLGLAVAIVAASGSPATAADGSSPKPTTPAKPTTGGAQHHHHKLTPAQKAELEAKIAAFKAKHAGQNKPATTR